MISARVFRPLRRLFGPLHHHRPALREEVGAYERTLTPLPAPWNGDNRWYRGGFPPRRHNHLTPLPHGDAYFTDLLAELAGAQTRVTIAGWCITPLMSLQGDETNILAEVLRDVSARVEVYVLIWSGAPALFEPDIHYARHARDTLLSIAPRIHFALDERARFSHDHHQKAVTIDGRVGYVGGMDLTTFQGNRWDSAQHPLRYGPNWHDVQVRLEGEVVQDVEENFCQRWNAVTGEQLTPLPPQVTEDWQCAAQIVRTVPAGFYPFAPNGEYGIAHAILAGIASAEHFIYMENQYLWAPEVVDALCAAMAKPRAHPFRVVIVLPARAYSGRYDNDRHVRLLRAAAQGKTDFEAYSIWAAGSATGQTGYAYRPIYVHAKVTIVDDGWFAVGSANLNRRGLVTDTEIDVQSVDPAIARQLRVALWAEHLGLSEAEVDAADPITLIDGAWKECASRTEALLRRGAPPAAGQVIRYQADTKPVARLLDRFQSATLEH